MAENNYCPDMRYCRIVKLHSQIIEDNGVSLVGEKCKYMFKRELLQGDIQPGSQKSLNLIEQQTKLPDLLDGGGGPLLE